VKSEFANANSHSFGYDGDCGSSNPGILTVHEFGGSLEGHMVWKENSEKVHFRYYTHQALSLALPDKAVF
jgi:hypothetical protein